jgi:hypothetical protein
LLKKFGINKSFIITKNQGDINYKAPEKSHATEELVSYNVCCAVRTEFLNIIQIKFRLGRMYRGLRQFVASLSPRRTGFDLRWST